MRGIGKGSDVTYHRHLHHGCHGATFAAPLHRRAASVGPTFGLRIPNVLGSVFVVNRVPVAGTIPSPRSNMCHVHHGCSGGHPSANGSRVIVQQGTSCDVVHRVVRTQCGRCGCQSCSTMCTPLRQREGHQPIHQSAPNPNRSPNVRPATTMKSDDDAAVRAKAREDRRKRREQRAGRGL